MDRTKAVFTRQISYLPEIIVSMPVCSEKWLLQMTLEMTKVRRDHDPRDLKSAAEVISKLVNDGFKSLKQCLSNENLLGELSTVETKDMLAKIEQNINKANLTGSFADWLPLIEYFKQLLVLLRPLDLEEMFRLIDETKKGADVIKGQDIILLLGKTGAGKSTTAHFLAGTGLKPSVNNQYVVDDAELSRLNESLKRIRISASANSETRFLSPVELDLKKLISKSGTMYLCDTPGFDDTAGAEVDIANAFGLIEAIHKCKKVRPVAVLNYDGIGGRLDGIIDLAQLLNRMFNKLEDVIQSLNYIYTKCPASFNVTMMLEQASMRNGLDDKIKDIINDMIKKSKADAAVIDPSKPESAKSLLKKLSNLQTPIENPGDEFKSFLTDQSLNQLKIQFSFHEKCVLNAVKRNDFELALYKLGQLKKLKTYLPTITWLDSNYQTIVSQISATLDGLYNESLSSFTRQLDNRNRITKADIDVYKTTMDKFKLVKAIISAHFDESKQTDYEKYLSEHLVSLCEKMCGQIRAHTFEDDGHLYFFNNIQMLVEHFGDLVKHVYQKLHGDLISKFADIKTAVSRHESLHDISFFISQFQISNRLCTSSVNVHSLLSKLFSRASVLPAPQLDDCLSIWLTRIQSELEQLLKSDLINESSVQDDFVSQATKLVSILQNSLENLALLKLVPKKTLSGIMDQFLEQIMVKITLQVGKIQSVLQSRVAKDSLSQIKPRMDYVRQLRRIPGVESLSNKSFYDCIDAISAFINQFNKIIAETFKKFKTNPRDASFDEINLFFQVMKDAEWINELKANLYSNSLKNYEKDVIRKIRSLNEELLDLGLGVRDHSNLETALDIYAQIQAMQPLAESNESIGEELEASKKSLGRRLRAALNEIRSHFDQAPSKLDNMEIERQRLTSIHKLLRDLISNEGNGEKVKESLKLINFDSVEKLEMTISRLEKRIQACQETKLSSYFERFDGEYLLNSVLYLEKLNRHKLARDYRGEISGLEASIRSFNSAYLAQKRELVNSSFDFINRADQSKEAEVGKCVQTIMSVLKELDAVKAKYSQAYEYLSLSHEKRDPLGAFREFFATQANELEAKLNRALQDGENSLVMNYIFIARYLRHLDPVVFDGGAGNIKSTFTNTYEQYSKEMNTEVQLMISSIKTALQDKDFRSLQVQLIRIDELALSPNQLRQIKSQVSFAIQDVNDDLTRTVKFVGRDLPMESILKLCTAWTSTHNSITYLSNIERTRGENQIIDPIYISDLKNAFQESKRRMKVRFNEFLSSTEESAVSFRFDEFTAKMKHFEEVLELLSDTVDDDGSLQSRFQSLKARPTEIIDTKTRELALMPITGYEKQSPKSFIENLEKATSPGSIYSEASNVIKANIIMKIRTYLNDRKSPVPAIERVEYVRSLHWFLPKTITDLLAPDLEKSILAPAQPAAAAVISSAPVEPVIDSLDVRGLINRGDVDKLSDHFYKKQITESLRKEIKLHVVERVKQLGRFIKEDSLKNTTITNSIEPFRVVTRFRQGFKDVPEIAEVFKEVRKILLNKYNEVLAEDLETLKNGKYSLEDIIEAQEKLQLFSKVIHILME